MRLKGKPPQSSKVSEKAHITLSDPEIKAVVDSLSLPPVLTDEELGEYISADVEAPSFDNVIPRDKISYFINNRVSFNYSCLPHWNAMYTLDNALRSLQTQITTVHHVNRVVPF